MEDYLDENLKGYYDLLDKAELIRESSTPLDLHKILFEENSILPNLELKESP